MENSVQIENYLLENADYFLKNVIDSTYICVIKGIKCCVKSKETKTNIILSIIPLMQNDDIGNGEGKSIIKRIKKMETYNFKLSRLGKEIKISPKTVVVESGKGISVFIGIGKEQAELSMSIKAWNDLKKGAKISITTTKQIKDKL